MEVNAETVGLRAHDYVDDGSLTKVYIKTR